MLLEASSFFSRNLKVELRNVDMHIKQNHNVTEKRNVNLMSLCRVGQ